jgi:ATP-dependent DNA helicase DinG
LSLQHDFQSAVGAVFEADGSLSMADPHFKPRAGQTEMALAVAEAITHKQALVVEAGTGVGKTYAYLVPALLSGQRILISTATKTLQDQLFKRDLPRLITALALPVKTALLKGRANYLCTHRLEITRQDGLLPDRASVRQLAKVEQWSQSTRTGDLAEMPGLDERSPLIPFITSHKENCLGSECTRYKDCHLMAARREAMAAEVVVVNHHLFFADVSVRESGVAELLPTVDTVIFDEAHQLNETGVNFLGYQLSSAQWIDVARDVLGAGLTHARGAADWPQLSSQIEKAARDLRLVFPSQGAGKSVWDNSAYSGIDAAAWQAAGQLCIDAAQTVGMALEPVLEVAPDFPRLQERLADLSSLVERFLAAPETGHVRWAEWGSGLRMLESPLDISELFKKQLAIEAQSADDWSQIDQDADGPEPLAVPVARRSWIFTSATLGHDDRLRWFTEPCGLTSAKVLRVSSPFDYKRQAVLFVPRDMAAPQDPQHTEQVSQLVEQVVRALHGRTLVLTTTLRALRQIGDHLRQAFAEASTIEVLIQGEGSKRELMERFRQESTGADRPGMVLVASASFWEGFDVPGQALQAVVIDKLPFPPPNDPLVEARAKSLQSQGRKPFTEYFIPEAAVSLKQGAGRLIRRETDKGVLVVCDHRLVTTGYGKSLMQALPDMARVSSPELLLEALRRLRAQD